MKNEKEANCKDIDGKPTECTTCNKLLFCDDVKNEEIRKLEYSEWKKYRTGS